MSDLAVLQAELRQAAVPQHERKGTFFKTGPGDYAEHDQFLGVPVPKLRRLVKTYRNVSMDEVVILLQSPINEERLLALFIMVARYQTGDALLQQTIFDLYCGSLQCINNWNLVDASAHLIVGAHLQHRDKTCLLTWAKSDVLWERRIAMVATWYFIRHHEFEWTIQLAEVLLQDQHDLMHKAVGWMLREAGKRNEAVLIDFLNQHGTVMPRTMLRYAIERLSPEQRANYLLR